MYCERKKSVQSIAALHGWWERICFVGYCSVTAVVIPWRCPGRLGDGHLPLYPPQPPPGWVSQDSYYLPWDAVSVYFGANTSIGTKYEAQEGEFTDMSVCGSPGTDAGDFEGNRGANRSRSCVIQGQIRESNSNSLAVCVIYNTMPRYTFYDYSSFVPHLCSLQN